ncbi:putative peptidase S26A, signal peptidase I, lysine active, lexA/Signal peptidase-like superfamily [Helianthus anomalus]
MEPIKCNHHPSQYPPLDHAEIKSQPFKLNFLTAIMAVLSSFLYSPRNYKERQIKRITGMPGDWISVPFSYDAVKIPEGVKVIVGLKEIIQLTAWTPDPLARYIPLGLIRGRVTHILWPPQRVQKIDKKLPRSGLSF